MKFVLASDSFKESMSAELACNAMARAIKKIDVNAIIDICPLADGGEGTAEILNNALKTQLIKTEVFNQRKAVVEATFGYDSKTKTAIIEAASAVGIDLVKKAERNPLKYTSYGVGQLINEAIKIGATEIICGLGGSGTNDGGLGMLLALGMKCYNSNNDLITPEIEEIETCVRVDLETLNNNLKGIKIEVASDVLNPYIGELGATATFGPQKGASEADLIKLERFLTHLNSLFINDLNQNLALVECSGAAGGLGGALYLVGAKLISGIDIVLDTLSFDDRIKDADFVFTGEGSIDSQTINGKTISGVAKRCKEKNIPVIAFAGRVTDDLDDLYTIGVTATFSITPSAMDLSEALEKGEASMFQTVKDVVRLLYLNK